MGRDIVASAKEFEDHAQKGNLPELLARELHSMNDADRLAVGKQIEWDMKHQSNPSLPKIELYDSGDLKSVETTSKSDTSVFTEHTELDKSSGKIRVELNTSDTKLSYEHDTRVELIERDANGNITHKYDSSTEIRGTSVKIENEDERWSYDAKTGKKVSHDEKTSSGKQVHEEYDANTGNLRQEDINNADKTHETIKYDSNGDKLSREKHYGNNGDQGTREWVYSPRTGKEVYTQWRAPDGKITKNNIENGKWIPIED